MDSEKLMNALRGNMIEKCKCNAYGSHECGCDGVLWPEDVAGDAADRIAALEAENARLEARVKRLVEALEACKQDEISNATHSRIDAALKEPQP